MGQARSRHHLMLLIKYVNPSSIFKEYLIENLAAKYFDVWNFFYVFPE